MSKYKICVYAICKNEERFVDRWMDAVSEADLVVAADTGSKDGTMERLRARGAAVYEEKIVPWRFDAARNAAMDHIPEDVDICVSNDLDEVFEPGWRARLEAAWSPACTRAGYLFTWSRNRDGSVEKQFLMEKIHRRHGFRWVHPVHEVLQYSGKDPEKTVHVPGMVLNHEPDLHKSRGQYLPLLELSARENPQDDRTSFWLGREYMYHKQYDEAIGELRRYLELPSAVWREERSAALRYIGSCYEEQGDIPAAWRWMLRAVAECPQVREPYLCMARMGYRQGDWPLVYFLVSEALKQTAKTGSYLFEPETWGWELYDLGAIACFWLEMYGASAEYAREALGLAPEDARLRRNLELIERRLSQK